MPAVPLSDFHEALRGLLGDEGSPAVGWDYEAEQLNGGLRSVIRMGYVPCLSLDADPDFLAAAPPNPDTWGFLVARAAHLMITGAQPVSVRTRAISVLTEAAARRDTLSSIEAMISDIDARGNVCGTPEETGSKGLSVIAGDIVTHSRLPTELVLIDPYLVHPPQAPAP